jgi:mono/diheme cytochrome c family protein
MNLIVRFITLLAFAATAATTAVGARDDAPAQASTKIDFARDIRPIFAKNCYACHGPEKQKSGLRLDRKREALAGGDSGAAIEPGKSAESLLIELVAGDDPDKVMPPKGDRLTAEQVGLLRAWIDQGAVWPESADAASKGDPAKTHWAFQPIRRPSLPPVKNAAWVRSPIDAFVLAKLESLGIEPSPEADRPTLIRRLSFDLLGLPPTPEEVDRFVNDTRSDAYEQLVERLLQSPHFGERWGRHWLDLARYADSDGYEKDSPRPFAWRYRNWVIDALNRDMPFDRFTIEQLAGDLLPNATTDQKTATGFHRNTLTNKEGGVDQEEYRVAAVIDRVNTTGTVWLGLTVGCAQCHTHKYDPLLQKEYYGLFAFFNTGKEVELPVPLPGDAESYAKAKAAFDPEHAKLTSALAEYDKTTRPGRQSEWERSVTAKPAMWSVLKPIEATASAGAQLTIKDDNSILASGTDAHTDSYTIKFKTDVTGITALRLEALDDPSLPSKGPGRTPHGNFVLTEFQVRAGCGDVVPKADDTPVALQNSTADFQQDGFPASHAIDGDAKTGWAISPKMGKAHTIVFETKEDLGTPGGTTLVLTVQQQYGGKHTLGRVRVSVGTAARPVKSDATPDDVLQILASAPEQRSDSQRNRLAEYHRSIDPEHIKLAAAVADHAKKAPKPPNSTVQTLAENASPPKTHILIRGDFLRKGDEVQAGTPGLLHALKPAGTTATRLDLSSWIMDPANPLTARVTVNRFWRHLFGRGLSPSMEDFGTRGEPPSHPELLDWLATEFPLKGWSQKKLIKLIVESATYRQSSRTRPELADRDPNNVWLARQTRQRLEAEVLRDVALATSGLLNPTVGGPSVRPPQPQGISDLTYAGSAKWVESQGPDRYRRGMYTWFQRTSPYPMLMTFDAPDSNVCAVKRERSNTPLQALTLLNDTVFFECAQVLAGRIVNESSGTTGDRLRFAFKVCLAREPSAEEFSELEAVYGKLHTECEAHPESAEKLIGQKALPGIEKADAAAWVAMARTLMNLDEFVTRE